MNRRPIQACDIYTCKNVHREILMSGAYLGWHILLFDVWVIHQTQPHETIKLYLLIIQVIGSIKSPTSSLLNTLIVYEGDIS